MRAGGARPGERTERGRRDGDAALAGPRDRLGEIAVDWRLPGGANDSGFHRRPRCRREEDSAPRSYIRELAPGCKRSSACVAARETPKRDRLFRFARAG
jgi:hypothetical protein